jgi:hypothetical protein
VCSGFGSAELVLSPKTQLLDIAFFERSINLTERGAYPLVTLLLKFATGSTGVDCTMGTDTLQLLLGSSLQFIVAMFSIEPLP